MGRAVRWGLIGCGALSILGVGFAVLFVVVLALSAPTGGPAASGESDGASERKEPKPCEVGAGCDLGESVVTITEAEATDFVATSLDNYEGNFVLVEFDYTYGGDQPATVEDYYWTLEDGQGRTYNYAFDPTSSYEIDKNRGLLYEEINPGIKRDGAIVFETAPNASDFTLHIEDLIQPVANAKADIPLP